MATKRKTARSRTAKQNEPIANRGVHGEGNYQASREYNEATEQFAKSGRVKEAARRAAPHSAAEAADLADAERTGRARSRGEDPADAGAADRDPDEGR